MKAVIWSTVFLLFYFIYGFYISQSDVLIISQKIKKDNPPGYYDYKGVMNVHSSFSIGSSSPLEIIDEAKKANLDFLFLTDLNVFDVLEKIDGYHGNLFVMNSNEYSYLDSRLLFYTLKANLNPSSIGEAQTYFTDILSQDSHAKDDTILVLAHPFKPGFNWSGEYPQGLDGIEVLNPSSMASKSWQENKASTLWSLLIYPFSPRLSFLRLLLEPKEETILFDELNSSRKVLMYSGANASARAIPLANYLVRFPSYQKSFEIVSNHLLLKSELTGNYLKDRQKIFTALKNGNFYTSVDLLGDPKGFNALVYDGTKQYQMGSEVKFKKGLKLISTLASEPTCFYEMVLFRNGERVATSNETKISYDITDSGVYRVIVRVIPFLPLPDAKKWLPWIYTNAFYIK